MGRKASIESKKRMSTAQKGKKLSKDAIERMKKTRWTNEAKVKEMSKNSNTEENYRRDSKKNKFIPKRVENGIQFLYKKRVNTQTKYKHFQTEWIKSL